MTTTEKSMWRRMTRAEEPEWLVWALVIGLLAVGVVVKTAVAGRMESFSASGVSLSYSAEWTQSTAPEQLLYAADLFSSAQFPTSVTVRQVPLNEIGRNLASLGDIAMAWNTQLSKELQVYRSLNNVPTTIDGQDAVMIEYAYVPQSTRGSGASAAPVVARAQDYLILRGDTLTIITLAANANIFETEASLARIMRTVKVQ